MSGGTAGILGVQMFSDRDAENIKLLWQQNSDFRAAALLRSEFRRRRVTRRVRGWFARR